MADVQVRYVERLGTGHDDSTHLAGANWKWSVDKVIQSITNKTNTFYALVNGKRANVGVVNGAHGKYVRTHADGAWNDNLLALPARVA